MFLKSRALTAVFSTIFALGFVNAGNSVKAQDAQDAPPTLSCTNSLLKGYYASQITGFTNSGTTPFNLAYLVSFDGNGNVKGVRGATSTGGEISENRSSTGTYQVNSDCTVTLIFVNASGVKNTNFGVIADSGKKILGIGTTPGVNYSTVFEKVSY